MKRRLGLRALGLGLITGASDDDPSAIGTYASAGARFGYGLLWMAPVTLPMMFAVVYLSSKLGQVTGKGLFGVLREHAPRWLLLVVLATVLVGNTFEAAADLGGMGAALALLVPLPRWLLVSVVALVLLALQVFGSYRLIRNLFRWVALSLLGYVGAAILARPDLGEVLAATFRPHLVFDREHLSLIVAIIGTSLSAYLYTWQSNEEVEERHAAKRREGASLEELAATRRDVGLGMLSSNLIMYAVMIAAGATLHRAGQTDIDSAAQAAQALAPLAGRGASLLFVAGIVGVGFLAVPIMTTGAAYDVCQTFGWPNGLGLRVRQAPAFYLSTLLFTAIAVAMSFFDINPMRALVWAGIVQGFSSPLLLLFILVLTNRRAVMGDRVNRWSINVLGGFTWACISAASVGLILSWLL